MIKGQCRVHAPEQAAQLSCKSLNVTGDIHGIAYLYSVVYNVLGCMSIHRDRVIYVTSSLAEDEQKCLVFNSPKNHFIGNLFY